MNNESIVRLKRSIFPLCDLCGIPHNQRKGNVECRLYMGNEFDERGRSKQGNKLCTNKSKCGTDKINILSRGKDEIVKSDLTDGADDVDYSLSKADFAWNIYNKRAGFNNL